VAKWQTRKLEVLVGNTVEVRVLSSAFFPKIGPRDSENVKQDENPRVRWYAAKRLVKKRDDYATFRCQAGKILANTNFLNWLLPMSGLICRNERNIRPSVYSELTEV
jgi:hypothetical protein